MANFRFWLTERFRSLFPFVEVDCLREANAQLQREKLSLEDRLDAALEDRTKLWHLVEESLQGERTAYQMHVNQAWQRQSGTIPYPEAPHLPPDTLPKRTTGEPVGRRGRMLASEMVARAARDFVAQQLEINGNPNQRQ